MLFANSAFCQTANKINPIDYRFEECIQQSGGTTPNMRKCYGDAFQQWDAVLNNNYKKLMQYLDTKQKKSLRIAQRAWIKFRDSEIDFMFATPSGGTIDMLHFDDKNLALTKQRAIELKGQLERIGQFSDSGGK